LRNPRKPAMSYIRFACHHVRSAARFYRNLDVHIHVPEGAIPKDGPSAGITWPHICSALKAFRCAATWPSDLCEITGRGKVRQRSGLEKRRLMGGAAGTAYWRQSSAGEEKDLADIRSHQKTSKIDFVESTDQVLKNAAEREWWLYAMAPVARRPAGHGSRVWPLEPLGNFRHCAGRRSLSGAPLRVRETGYT